MKQTADTEPAPPQEHRRRRRAKKNRPILTRQQKRRIRRQQMSVDSFACSRAAFKRRLQQHLDKAKATIPPETLYLASYDSMRMSPDARRVLQHVVEDAFVTLGRKAINELKRWNKREINVRVLESVIDAGGLPFKARALTEEQHKALFAK
jgi:hypothetical protein